MPYIGCHLSCAKGFYHMGLTASQIHADTFQFFTRNPRGGKSKPLDLEDCAKLRELMKEQHFGPIIAHAPYTINPCSQSESVREFAVQTMAEDLHRMEYLPGNFYNFHPGSHVGQGAAYAIPVIADALNQVMFPQQTTVVLLETMAGKGSEIGATFSQLQEILEKVCLNDKIGVCIDTCHIHDGGYDIIQDFDGVLTQFDKEIGLKRLKAIHLNDSRNPRGSHKDRHACLGDGYLGWATVRRIICHPQIAGLPVVLETPNELDGYAREIMALRQILSGSGNFLDER